MDSLLQLAERCEAAEGPDRELDLAIWAACIANEQQLGLVEAGRKLHGNSEAAFRADRMSDGARYTASLDAAMMLVPEGLEWELFGYDAARDPRFGRFQARIMLLTYAEDPDELGPQAIANAATPALALCAAALRARHSQGVSDNG